jgi:hypothetical protein
MVPQSGDECMGAAGKNYGLGAGNDRFRREHGILPIPEVT